MIVSQPAQVVQAPAPQPIRAVATAKPAADSAMVADRVTVSVAKTAQALSPTHDPVKTSMFHPDPAWAQTMVTQDYAALGINFHPHVKVDKTSYVDDGEALIHLARFKFSPALRQVTQRSMVDTSFSHLIRHESSHAFYNSTWKPELRPAFTAAFGDPDAPYNLGVWAQATCPIRRHDSPDFVSKYAQEHPAEDFAETMGVYLRLHGDPSAVQQYVASKGNSPTLQRKFAYITALVAANKGKTL